MTAITPRTTDASRKRDIERHQFADGTEAHVKARHMARYSHRRWIAWHSQDDTRHYAQIVTADSLKAALLDIGTQGHFYQYYPGYSYAMVEGWRIGLNMRNHLLKGYDKN